MNTNRIPHYTTEIFGTVDSGRNLGWSLFYEGKLVQCGLYRQGKSDIRNYLLYRPFVVEIPQYQKGDSPSRINDCITCAVRGAEFVGRCQAVKVDYVSPHSWKGSVPKNIHNGRVLEALIHNEVVVLQQAGVPASLVDNTIDSIGLGLVCLGRMR